MQKIGESADEWRDLEGRVQLKEVSKIGKRRAGNQIVTNSGYLVLDSVRHVKLM